MRTVLPPIRRVDRRTAGATGQRDELWDAGYSNPQNCTRYVERHDPAAARCPVRGRDRRDRLDLPHHVLGRFLRHAAKLARPARASDPAQLEEARHHPVDVDRAAVLHRPLARVAVQRRRGAAARRLSAGAGGAPQRAASPAASRHRRRAAVRADPRPPVSDAQGALRGWPAARRHAASRNSSRRPPKTPGPSAISCAITCCDCRASPS